VSRKKSRPAAESTKYFNNTIPSVQSGKTNDIPINILRRGMYNSVETPSTLMAVQLYRHCRLGAPVKEDELTGEEKTHA
jgi:hypothetical protein